MSVAVIGECMLELSHGAGQHADRVLPMNMNYGGDTLNTAVYLCRNNVPVSYVTGLGDDVMSDWLIDEWRKEGVDCSMVIQLTDSVPGMYMINVDETGERSFLYWRANSPASRLFDDPARCSQISHSISEHSHVYLSGISLAILPERSRERLFGLLTEFRQAGGKLIFDGNYRPKLWGSVKDAKKAYNQMYAMTDIALPTLEDEELMYGSVSAEKVIAEIKEHGVAEYVVKMGSEGCFACTDDGAEFVAAVPVDPVDTTAAGDSFNAGYLAARLGGGDMIEACKAGHALAAEVIQHQGAIINNS